jgi:DNA (cytosine-5)-methyltransferase 1
MTLRAVDLFCGAGGTSTGLALAAAESGQRVELTAVNHWERAVETHSANHPDAKHYCEPIDSLDPRRVVRGRLDLLVASPECTHHSNARGGKPISDQSRATAWCVIRWADALQPRVILVENVAELQTWGPLTTRGRPMRSRRGETYRAWIGALESLGYRVQARILNAADYGDATTRRRLFVLAWRGRSQAPWPDVSHTDPQRADLFSAGLDPWRPARDVLDWSIEGRSIFARKRPLAAKTIARIADGLRRFGGEDARPFLAALDGAQTARSIDDALPSDLEHVAVCEPFVIPQQSGGVPRPVHSPLPTIATAGAISVVQPFLVRYYGQGTAESIRRPVPTITTRDRFGLVQPAADLDIRFRMLQPHELSAAMSFPEGYQFTGSRQEQVKQIGNAVPVRIAKALTGKIMASIGRAA